MSVNRTLLTALSLVWFLVSALSCVAAEQQADKFISHIDASVVSVSGREMELFLKTDDAVPPSQPNIDDVVLQIQRRGLFLEGISTTANGVNVAIKNVSGRHMTVLSDTPLKAVAGGTVRLKVPTKTIAITDFEIIRGADRDAGRIMLERLTSALIETGQFMVVERSKLSAVMAELDLKATGLFTEYSGKKAGKLLNADLILTGTMLETGGLWELNLRLLNARTGHAQGAINMSVNLQKTDSFRDPGSFVERFETDQLDATWMSGIKAKGRISVLLDPSGGMSGSRCLRLDFNLKQDSPDMYVNAENRKKRDLSSYAGIEFFVRATDQMQGHARMLISDRDDPLMMDAWVAGFSISREWTKVRIPFDQFSVARKWIRGGAVSAGMKPGRQVRDLGFFEGFSIGFNNTLNPSVLKGSLWIDNLTFYR